MRFWVGADHGDEGLGEGGEGDVAVPAGVGAALEVVQAQAGFQFAVVVLDGLITNGKFCCVRRVRLSLSWWHRPLRLRGSVLHSDVALAGEPDDPDMDRVPAARPVSRRRAWFAVRAGPGRGSSRRRGFWVGAEHGAEGLS